MGEREEITSNREEVSGGGEILILRLIWPNEKGIKRALLSYRCLPYGAFVRTHHFLVDLHLAGIDEVQSRPMGYHTAGGGVGVPGGCPASNVTHSDVFFPLEGESGDSLEERRKNEA